MTYTSSPDGPSLAVPSSPDEWEEAGRKLFQNKRYAHAVQSFQRASLTREAAIANAYLLREQAHAMPPAQPDSITLRSKSFVNAAKAFVECALPTTAESRTYYRIAAECYWEGREVSKAAVEKAAEKAAELYIKAEEIDCAACLYLDAGMHAQAIKITREKKRKMQVNVVNHIVHECRLHYYNKQEFSYVFQFQLLMVSDLLLTYHPQPSQKVVLF
jgi:hypothetical protein